MAGKFKPTDAETSAIEQWRYIVEKRGKQLDPNDELGWYSMSIGFFEAKLVDIRPRRTIELAVYVRSSQSCFRPTSQLKESAMSSMRTALLSNPVIAAEIKKLDERKRLSAKSEENLRYHRDVAIAKLLKARKQHRGGRKELSAKVALTVELLASKKAA